jgi:transmembrane sensor
MGGPRVTSGTRVPRGMTGPSSPHSPDSAPDWEAIARFLSGESDGPERARVQAWMAANPEDHQLVEALDRVAASIPVAAPAGLDVEAALRRTKAAAGPFRAVLKVEDGSGRRRRNPVTAPSFWSRPAFRMAAAFAVVALSATLLLRRQAPDVQVAESQTYRASPGKPDSVTLSDGSRAVIAPGSELVVAAGYGRTSRELTLRGQGWFRAEHDDALPFIVNSADAVVRDVGTEFTVNHREATGVLVQVHEGSVMVRGVAQDTSAFVLLEQGDEAIVVQGAVSTASRGTVPVDAADWVSGLLRFRDVPMAEVVETVRRWYGTNIRIEDPTLASRKVSIDVNAGSVGSVAEELALTVGGRVDRRGDTLVVRTGR